jgi:spermidine synthase
VVLVAAGAAAVTAASDGPCDVETRYHCARVVVDRSRPGGRVLRLDILPHSYVDLDDPAHLEFRYSRLFADVVAGAVPGGRPLDVLHIGGGGFTMPRYLTAVHPGSRHLVLEVDPVLVDLARERLGLVTGPRLVVRVGDARLLLRRLPDASWDAVLGDAFGDLAVPWHLTTVEFLRDVRRVLRPGGVYMLNLIDHPPLRFARAQAATLGRVFDHVAVLAPPRLLAGEEGGNYVLGASDRPFDESALVARVRARNEDDEILTGAGAVAFAAGSGVLSDDYAPVDQWLARSRRSAD